MRAPASDGACVAVVCAQLHTTAAAERVGAGAACRAVKAQPAHAPAARSRAAAAANLPTHVRRRPVSVRDSGDLGQRIHCWNAVSQ
ncbi:hypothetical protein V500_05552 [Pseudogymnoascus sp. VKM F-4518 (FW-2643)]|nr:hypothetical protein V500_05552 [Pseudogymnoascus sp. VKM F-4518 (FW-2643)]